MVLCRSQSVTSPPSLPVNLVYVEGCLGGRTVILVCPSLEQLLWQFVLDFTDIHDTGNWGCFLSLCLLCCLAGNTREEELCPPVCRMGWWRKKLSSGRGEAALGSCIYPSIHPLPSSSRAMAPGSWCRALAGAQQLRAHKERVREEAVRLSAGVRASSAH
jgi:hypothetical protein